MINHKRFIVITEFNDIGHVIGSYDSLDEAQTICEVVFNLQQPKGGSESYYEETHNLLIYKVHPTGRYISAPQLHFTTDGTYSAMCIDCESIHNFSIKEFMFLRANTVYAFDIDKYETSENRFVKEFLLFIAN